MNERWNDAVHDMNDEALAKLEAEMAGDLRDLRAAATMYAERVNTRLGAARIAQFAPQKSAWAGARLGWAGAGVAAVALLIGGGLHTMHHGGSDAPVNVGSTATAVAGHDAGAVSDEALLDQIQSDLSTGVPAAMQPLATNNGQRSTSASQSRNE